MTDGVCASTTHRVLSPRKGEGARYSVPFFQGVSYDAQFEAMDVPQAVLELRDEARKGRRDDVEFTFVKGRWGHLGEATLMNRIKSHPDVGERWVSLVPWSTVTDPDVELTSSSIPNCWRRLGQPRDVHAP